MMTVKLGSTMMESMMSGVTLESSHDGVSIDEQDVTQESMIRGVRMAPMMMERMRMGLTMESQCDGLWIDEHDVMVEWMIITT